MPHCSFRGLLTNTPDRAGSVPIQVLQSKKQQHLWSPLDIDAFGPQYTPKDDVNHWACKEMSQAIREQTKVLAEILEVL